MYLLEVFFDYNKNVLIVSVITAIILIILSFIVWSKNKKKLVWLIPFGIGVFTLSTIFFIAIELLFYSGWGLIASVTFLTAIWFIFIPAILLVIIPMRRIFKKGNSKNEQ